MSRVAVVAAGGTGGHMFPAEALARVLTARGWRVVLATDTRGAQYAQHFPATERIALNASTFKAGDVFGMVRSTVEINSGASQAKAAFRRLDPAIVVGFGGEHVTTGAPGGHHCKPAHPKASASRRAAP